MRLQELPRGEAAVPSFVCAVGRLTSKAKRMVLQLLNTIVEARSRRVRQELEFRRSLDQYCGSVGLPVLHDDDPILF
jgi:hypothetical protein